MRIACLQFNPQVGDVNNNMTRADQVLAKYDNEDLDLLVLPEMAFTGKHFAKVALQASRNQERPVFPGEQDGWC